MEHQQNTRELERALRVLEKEVKDVREQLVSANQEVDRTQRKEKLARQQSAKDQQQERTQAKQMENDRQLIATLHSEPREANQQIICQTNKFQQEALKQEYLKQQLDALREKSEIAKSELQQCLKA